MKLPSGVTRTCAKCLILVISAGTCWNKLSGTRVGRNFVGGVYFDSYISNHEICFLIFSFIVIIKLMVPKENIWNFLEPVSIVGKRYWIMKNFCGVCPTSCDPNPWKIKVSCGVPPHWYVFQHEIFFQHFHCVHHQITGSEWLSLFFD